MTNLEMHEAYKNQERRLNPQRIIETTYSRPKEDEENAKTNINQPQTD